MSEETSEEILEARIAELEKKIFGFQGRLKGGNAVPETNVLDNIDHVNTLITSALSGRERLNTLIQRIPELEEMAKTDFEPVDQQLDMKLEYILAMEPEIRENAERLKKLQELLPILDSNRFNNLPEMTEKLSKLSLDYMELGDETGKIDQEAKDIVSRYNEIITNISKTLIYLNNEVSELEKEAEPKKVVD